MVRLMVMVALLLVLLIAGVASAATVEEDRGTVNPCVGTCPFADCADGLPWNLCGIIPSAACGINFIQNDCRLTCQQCKL